MNIISVVLFERLHRYVYDEYLNLKKPVKTDEEIYWNTIYNRYAPNFNGWRIVLAIWFPFVKRYRRYSYYKSTLSSYELSKVSRLSRIIYRLKN